MEPVEAQRTAGSALALTMAQLQSERRWFMLMRLTFGGVCISWLLLVLWMIPNGPISDIVPGYSAFAALGLLFAVLAFCGSLAFFFIWRPSFTGEPVGEFVRVLLGGGLLIRRAGQFKARLRRRGSSESAASLFVVQLSGDAGSGREARRFDDVLPAVSLRSIARGDDIIAVGETNQLWLLAGVGEELRHQVVARIARALPGLPHFQGAQIGSVTVTSGQDALSALQAATASLTTLEEAAGARAA